MSTTSSEQGRQFTLGGLLRGHAVERPGAPCLTFRGETLTYLDLHQRSSRLANALMSAGLSPGDRVAILARNAPVFYELEFACAKAGTIMVPINWRLSAREVAGVLADAEPRLVLTDAEFADKLPESGSSAPSVIIDLDKQYQSWLQAASATDPERVVAAGDTVLLLYTSGTTGRPKGVMISHHNLFFSERMAREIWRFTADSVNLVGLPLFHIGGIGYGQMALTQGGHTVLLTQPSPEAVVDAITTHRVSHTFLVPAVIQALVDYQGVDDMDMSSLELMVYGSSPISETLLLRAMAVFGCGFTHAYGMTETAGTVITLLPEEHDPGGHQVHRLRSCGRPLPWIEAGLFNPETNQEVPVGEAGEIWIRSEMNTAGYWNKPEETAATLLPDGWLRTGDAAFRDADGYYYIHDRYKDMIISGGENIYPTEIENVLYEHPGIAEAAVVGVPHERWGETPKAIVVARDGASLSEQELIDFVRERLARYKCPTAVAFVSTLPRNASGKILKHELRAQYGASGSAGAHSGTQSGAQSGAQQ